ncbi:MAG: biotin--[acetyl-CoA-carboxylase] ligase [Coriobacteriales bacterium]|nr:biotin--[acetyl-CoA-carboxylase] ligase [Coriobacteriales bacterium]
MVVDEVTSTNDELRGLIQAREGVGVCQRDVQLDSQVRPSGTPPNTHATPLCVVSARQTAGRGRLGRPWASPEGGVYLSLLLEPVAGLDACSALPLVVALGVRDALAALASTNVCIKWPNDVMTPQGKLAGILVETATTTQKAPSPFCETVAAAQKEPLPPCQPLCSRLIVGIGINVNRPVQGAFEQAAYLNDGATSPTILLCEAIAAAVISKVLARYDTWQQSCYRFVPFKDEYECWLTLMGQEVTVRAIDGTPIAAGQVQGVDEAGRILLLSAGITTPVTAGEVTLREPASNEGARTV